LSLSQAAIIAKYSIVIVATDLIFFYYKKLDPALGTVFCLRPLSVGDALLQLPRK
jgi:hypothetical protein